MGLETVCKSILEFVNFFVRFYLSKIVAWQKSLSRKAPLLPGLNTAKGAWL